MNLTTYNTPKVMHPYLRQADALYQEYLVIMALKRRRANLHGRQKLLAYARLMRAYMWDVWFNLITASRMFNDLPRELTFTARLKRYRRGDDPRCRADAEYICEELLDVGDPDGNHC